MKSHIHIIQIFIYVKAFIDSKFLKSITVSHIIFIYRSSSDCSSNFKVLYNISEYCITMSTVISLIALLITFSIAIIKSLTEDFKRDISVVNKSETRTRFLTHFLFAQFDKSEHSLRTFVKNSIFDKNVLSLIFSFTDTFGVKNVLMIKKNMNQLSILKYRKNFKNIRKNN